MQSHLQFLQSVFGYMKIYLQFVDYRMLAIHLQQQTSPLHAWKIASSLKYSIALTSVSRELIKLLNVGLESVAMSLFWCISFDLAYCTHHSQRRSFVQQLPWCLNKQIRHSLICVNKVQSQCVF